MQWNVPRTLTSFAVAVIFVIASRGFAQTSNIHEWDPHSNRVEKLAKSDTRVIVLIFAATDCPISNRYIPEITRLDKDLVARGVSFWWVFPNPGDTLAVVRKHQSDFSITTPALIDPAQELVKVSRASVTPEAAVFEVRHGEMHEVYHGRIDDRYIAFGQERPQATHHDLEDVIHSVLTNQPMPTPSGSPVGCSIIPVALKP
jgi:hypothetical protein